MSWAEGRETTVPEDRAYSLMGIFDVNMPLIYGEGGTKAFRRLQEEIARMSSDLSIVAWDPSDSSCSQANKALDAFASRPDEFVAYKDMVPSYQSQHFTRTNKGIEMETILWRVLCEDKKERLMLPIGKQRNGKLDVGIILRKVGHNVYVRRGTMRPFAEEQVISSTRKSTFYVVSPSISTGYDYILNTSRERAISIPQYGLGRFDIGRLAPEYAWDCEDRLFFNNRHWGGSDWRAVELVDENSTSRSDRSFVVVFSLKTSTPECYLLRWSKDLTLMFNRRHQTETTSLDDFRHIVQGAANEVDTRRGRKLSAKLIPTITDKLSGMRLDMKLLGDELAYAPVVSASAIPSTHRDSRASVSRLHERSVHFPPSLSDTTLPRPLTINNGLPVERAPRPRVFSEFQGVDIPLTQSNSTFVFAALAHTSAPHNDAPRAALEWFERDEDENLFHNEGHSRPDDTG